MSIESIFAFISIVFVITIVPGPNTLLILHTSLSARKLNAFFNIIGISFGFIVYAMVSALGLSLLLAKSASAFALLKWLGVGYLLWLGYSHIRDSVKVDGVNEISETKVETLRQSFIRGLFTNLLNPKIVMFYLSIFPQFISKQSVITDSLILGIVQAFIVSAWFSLVILLASRLAGWLSTSMNKARLNRLSGVVYILFSTKLAMLKL